MIKRMMPLSLGCLEEALAVLAGGFVMFLLVGCQRAELQNASVHLQFPSAPEFYRQQKIVPFANAKIPYDRLCFAVNVKNDKIPNTAKACDIVRGMVEGSVPPEGTLTIEIAGGSATTFEVYGLLRESSSESCPSGLQSEWNWPLEKIYFLGKAENVAINPPEVQVDILISLPEIGQHVVTQNSLPISCRTTPPVQPTVGRTQVSAALLVGNAYKAYSRVSETKEIRNLKGAQFQIHNWKASSE